ncbi:Surface antigen protein [Labilithrix luteola]|uniref:Surface antigen protein n=1 Tax=Labilithrix luteola TaxID=1391654 RepID=A0A0K1QBK2_9BACT|nr:Surface antigen protein [Labilithrix luteola]
MPDPVVHRLGATQDGSAVLLAESEGHVLAFVADEDDAMVRVLDVDEGTQISAVRTGGAPAQLVMLPDGRAVASLRDKGELVVLAGAGRPDSKFRVERRIEVAAEPIGLALSPDDGTLVVASGWGRRVSVFDTKTMTRIAEHEVAREPRAVVVSHDGKRAFVSHAVGNSLDVVELDGKGAKRVVPMAGVEEFLGRGDESGTQSRMGCQGFTLARAESGKIFAPHALVFTGDASEASDGYGGGEGREAEVFHVPVVDEDTGKPLAGTSRLRAGLETHSGRCALPRAAAVGKAGLFVTCLGADSVALFDSDAVNPQDVELRRWAVPSGPVGIALDESRARAVVWSQFAHALTTIAIGDSEAPDGVKPFALSSFALARDVRGNAKLARGRAIFHATDDRRISSDGRACASCHPDGRDDTLVWSSPKGPRQTPMLAGRLEGAAPFGWNGDASDVSLHLVSTVKRLGGSGLDGEDKEALVAYVRSMRSPPSSSPSAKSTAWAHGRELFRSTEAGCSSCHGESGDLPDGDKHDVKSRAAGDTQAKFDTPSLRFVGGSAPYFHDGRYADLKTLLVKSDGKMGHTKHLSPSDLADLTTYLESL